MLPFFPVTNVGVTAGANVGAIDNVAETRSADGSVDRRGALFSGLNGTMNFRYESARGDSLNLFANARGQVQTRFDGQGSNLTGVAALNGAGRLRLGKFTSGDVQFATSIADNVAARAGDGTLGQRLDPLIQGTTFAVTDANATVYQELGKFYRLSVSLGATVTTVVDAPPLLVGDGLQLDRTGVDGVTIQTRASLIRELDARSTGDVALGYRRVSAPYSINSFSIPPRLAGPQDNHQVTADVGYTRALSDRWQSLSRLGVSFASPPAFDPDKRIVLFPVASQAFNFIADRYFASIGANLSYSALVPRLGTGPLFSLSAGLAGQPFTQRKLKEVVVAFSASANYASTNTITNDTFHLLGAGITTEARYPLSRILALHGGYDFFLSRSSSDASNVASVTSFRNTVFVGVSGYWSMDGTVVPMTNRAIPR